MTAERRGEVVRKLSQERVVAVVRVDDAAPFLHIVEALLAGGINTIELTLTSRGALDALTQASARFGSAALLGAGSVFGAEQAKRAVESGSQFLVSPVVEADLVSIAHAADVAACPGAMTPNEVFAAQRLGADLVKLFPAGRLGAAYLRDLLAPLPGLAIMATGGVNEHNANEFIGVGAIAVGVGGALVGRAAVEASDWAAVTRAASELALAVRAG